MAIAMETRMALRMTIVGILSLVLTIPAIAARDVPRADTTTRAELIRIVNEQLDANTRGDMTTYGRHLAADLVYISSEGGQFTKDQILSSNFRLIDQGVIKRFGPLRDIRLIEQGDSAVLIARVTEDVVYADQKITYDLVRSSYFVKRNGEWQAVLIQRTELPQNHLTPQRRKASELRAFAGRYALTKGRIVTVKFENGKLFSRTWAGGTWDELVPVGNHAFRWENDPADITFVAPAGGKVTHYVYRRPDGQQLIARRVGD
jgi:hypothetical protein